MVIYTGNRASTHFLNVDLDICSRADLHPLVTAFGKKVVILHAGRIRQSYCAHLELAAITRSADAAIRAFCSLVEALPTTARKLWNGAWVRDFNVGVQACMQPHSTEFALAVETLKASQKAGARIVFTVYAPEPPAKVRARPAASRRYRSAGS